MILAFTKSSASRLATVGLVAVLFAGCATPTVSPTTAPSPLATLPPTTPPYTLAPSMSPSGGPGLVCPTTTPDAFTGKATVTMTTNFGDIVISVDGSLGANAAGAFLALARCGYYNNIVFHRVIPGFIIQAGDGDNARLPNLKPGCKTLGTGGPSWKVQDDKVISKYKRGTISMARTGAANSGSSQFFIVLADSAGDTLGDPTTANNYAIFGDVTKGMDVVDAIAAVPTGGDPCPDGQGGSSPLNMPLAPIVITSTIVS
jgi:cyclophilin family peptidyl-prolyl cis-trans isomerase